MTPILLHHVESLTPRLKTFWFEKPENFSFTPGEYVEMLLEHASVDSRGENRKFTISSAPSDTYLGFTISFSAYGSSFKEALLALAAGESVRISEPIGDFVLPKLPDIPIVGIAVGSGITPFMSMASQLRERAAHVIHIVRAQNDLISIPVLEVAPHVLHEDDLQPQKVLNQELIQPTTFFYLAGPEKLVDALRNHLLQQAVPTSQIVTDRFIGAANL